MADILIEYDIENGTCRTKNDSSTPEFVFSTTPTIEIKIVRGSGAVWGNLPASGSAVLSVDVDWARSTNVCARKTISFLNPYGVLTFPDVNFSTVKMGEVTDGRDYRIGMCQLKIFADGNLDPVRVITFECWLVNIMDAGEPGVEPDPSPESYYLPRAEYVAGVLREGAAVAIPDDVRTVAITFERVQSSPPSAVVVSLMAPAAGSDFIFADVNASSITTAGFTARLSAATTGADYKLAYFILK